MTKRKWFWLICLSPLIGLEIYDGVQGAIAGLAMKKYCEAEAGLKFYPNVKYDSNSEYCFKYSSIGCPNKTVVTRTFVPVFGAVSTPQRIYIMERKEEDLYRESGTFKGGGLVREVHHYFTAEGEPLGEYIIFKPNGLAHFPAGSILYDMTRSKKFWDGGHGCYVNEFSNPMLGHGLYNSKKQNLLLIKKHTENYSFFK